MKFCRPCASWKEKSEFYPDKSSRTGLRSRCKECVKADSLRQKHDFREKNPLPVRPPAKTLEERKEAKRRALQNLPPILAKKCKACEQVKAICEFKPHLMMKDGYSNSCSSCMNAKAREVYYEKNRDRIETTAAAKSAKVSSPTQVCIECKEEKLKTEFYAQSAALTKLSPLCKECSYAGLILWRSQNPERYRYLSSSFYYRNRDRLRLVRRVYHYKNRERLRVSRQVWYYKNREVILQKAKATGRKNRETVRDPYARVLARSMFKVPSGEVVSEELMELRRDILLLMRAKRERREKREY